MVLNLIGRWLYYVENIENDNIWRQVSPANWRLNSSVTHLKRTLRPFLLYDGEKLGEVDITASQPYILSAVTSNNFITGNEGCFNLQAIYPEVLDRLKTAGYITSSRLDNFYSFGYTSYSGSSMHSDFNLDSVSSTGSIKNTYSFIWGSFFNEMELDSIKSYQSSPFDSDFYKFLSRRVNLSAGQKALNESVLREKIKDNMKLVLFDDNINHRLNISYLKMFRELYPGVDKWIYLLLTLIGKTEFSYLLQRAESYLVLDVVSRDFHEKNPTAPIFTIHDSICTYPEYLPDLKKSILGHFQRIVGHPVGLKETLWISNPELKTEDIEDEWSRIKSVNSAKKFENERYKVFSSNIKRASEFFSLKSHLR